MKHAETIQFDAYRLDQANARLWRDEQPIPLTPRAFDLLVCLADHAGLLMTKEQLLHLVWDDTLVSDAALCVCICEIRKALGDDARKPRFIETAHRRGYRFIAPVAASTELGASIPELAAPAVAPGREAELSRLTELLEEMGNGVRQLLAHSDNG